MGYPRFNIYLIYIYFFNRSKKFQFQTDMVNFMGYPRFNINIFNLYFCFVLNRSKKIPILD